MTALCTACLPDHYSIATEVPSGGWEVSAKHLQCVHILLNSALCLGPQMDTGWNLIIATCQQVWGRARGSGGAGAGAGAWNLLTWLLKTATRPLPHCTTSVPLRRPRPFHSMLLNPQLVSILDLPDPTTGKSQGSFATGGSGGGGGGVSSSSGRRGHRRTNSGSYVAMTASVASELPALAAMLAQVFEMTRTLDDRALQHVVGALCQQSEATLEQVGFVWEGRTWFFFFPLFDFFLSGRGGAPDTHACILHHISLFHLGFQVSAAQSVNHTIFRNMAHMFPVDKLLEVVAVAFSRSKPPCVLCSCPVTLSFSPFSSRWAFPTLAASWSTGPPLPRTLLRWQATTMLRCGSAASRP